MMESQKTHLCSDNGLKRKLLVQQAVKPGLKKSEKTSLNALLNRNVPPRGGASERSSVGPSTRSFTAGGATTGNLCILVGTATKHTVTGYLVKQAGVRQR